MFSFTDAKKPEVNPFKFSGTLAAGKRASVTCAVIDGDPPFAFEWYKDDIPLKSGSSIIIKATDEFSSNLVIVNLGPENNGNYTCRVSNSHGKDEQWDALFMKGIIEVLIIVCNIYDNTAFFRKCFPGLFILR